jgi:hypothetical protein
VDTHVAATPAIAVPSVSLDLAAVSAAPSRELELGRWPVWRRLAILIIGSALLWAGLGWVAFQVLKLG